jgi:hypothetical protein
MPKTKGQLPDFILVGATKAGTTSLDFYLSLHPEIHMARPKEPRFFIDAPEPQGRWCKGKEWYTDLFRTYKKICGESTPAYTHSPALPSVPERMARLVPHAKLIYLVREPMERMKSHFLMSCRFSGKNHSLAEFLSSNPESRCLLASCYGSQLEKFLQCFPSHQILILESAQLARKRSDALCQVFEFLGVNSQFDTPLFTVWRNVTGHQRIPNATGRRILDSMAMKMAKATLRDSLYYLLRNLILLPFGAPDPSLEIPNNLLVDLQNRFRYEMSLLRSLTGQKLESLKY